MKFFLYKLLKNLVVYEKNFGFLVIYVKCLFWDNLDFIDV